MEIFLKSREELFRNLNNTYICIHICIFYKYNKNIIYVCFVEIIGSLADFMIENYTYFIHAF